MHYKLIITSVFKHYQTHLHPKEILERNKRVSKVSNGRSNYSNTCSWISSGRKLERPPHPMDETTKLDYQTSLAYVHAIHKARKEKTLFPHSPSKKMLLTMAAKKRVKAKSFQDWRLWKLTNITSGLLMVIEVDQYYLNNEKSFEKL